MAFLRYAKTQKYRTLPSTKAWERTRVAATEVPTIVGPNLIEQASEIFNTKFNPDNYLLTHATIVASVDTYEVPGTKTGSVKEGSFTINRKYSDYRVKPECDSWINNNNDLWERRVLLSSYQTFVGAQNFLEHDQRVENSKGRIIDACARDIGDSVYVDILVATERKHRQLIAAIESNELNSLSMGCTIEEGTCTKCGHVAVDEPQQCSHVRFEKGNYFHDELGRRHRIAEACGHHSISPTGGVHFIEGSWVHIPAFGGAILRNILSPSEITSDTIKRAQAILLSPPKTWSPESMQGIVKAATLLSMVKNSAFDFGEEEGGEPEPEAEAEGEKDKDTLGQLEQDAKKEVIDRIKKQLQKEIGGKSKGRLHDMSRDTNEDDNLNKQASQRVATIYRDSIVVLLKSASSDVAFLQGVAGINYSFGIQVPVDLYRTVLKVGSTIKYHDLNGYIQACQNSLGRIPSSSESRTLVRLGNLLAQRSG